MDVIEALADLVAYSETVISGSEHETDYHIVVKLGPFQDFCEAVEQAQRTLDWYREREAEAAA